jgi:DNA invertase Pin-like site-specific DNA recombinase
MVHRPTGRRVLHVAERALAEPDTAGVALYSDQQAIDCTTPMGRAMIQMASVFGEQERQIIRSRVLAGLDRVRQQGKKLGRPKVSAKTEDAIRRHLSAGNGMLKVAALVGVGSGTVQRVKRRWSSGWRTGRDFTAGETVWPTEERTMGINVW